MADLNPQTWRQARALFEACLDLAPPAREALLEDKSEASPTLVGLVRAMLAADDQTHSPMEIVADLAGSVIGKQTVSEDLIGAEVGAFRICKELGTGGMSTVYLAERTDGKFEQQVAIKVLKTGMDHGGITTRFRNEQHILARLEHPHIARLLEAGELPDGRPCFVLEYVHGEPIDQYCDRKKLTLPQRITLFRDVCDAVAFAHGNLILHRDIKPSNILVDTHGKVKLLDFGIAKVLEPGLLGETLRTRTHFRLLTPEYAAPEQLEGQPLTTACDIFSLGVVFFQLLTGSRPTGKTQSTPGTTRSLRTKPSDLFTGKQDPQSMVKVCQQRQTTAVKARRLLKGDLDTIASVALHQEPLRRYASATQFREDLDHFLAGKPIAARGDSFAYLFSKFIGRHKLAVGFATLAFISLITGFSLALIHYRQAVTQRDLARAETMRAEQLVDLLTNVFRSSSPGQSKGEDLSAKEVLDRGAETVFKRLEGDVETQLRLTNAMAVVYRNLGELDQANTMLEEAMARAGTTVGRNHMLVGNTARTLGSLRSWQREYDASETFYKQAIAIHERAGDTRELARDLGEISTVYLSTQQYDKAEAVLNRAIAIHETLQPPFTERWLSALSNRAVLYYFQKQDDRAGEAYAVLLEKQKSHFGEHSRSVATTLHNMASLKHRQRLFSESAALFEQALATKEAVYGVDSTFSKGTLRNLAKVYFKMRRFDEAVATYKRAYTTYRQFMGADHDSTFQVRLDYANALHFQGHIQEAESHYRQGLAEVIAKHSAEHRLAYFAKLHLTRFLLLEHRGLETGTMGEEVWNYYQKTSPESLSAGIAQSVYGASLLIQNPHSQPGHKALQAGADFLAAKPKTTDPLFETARNLQKLIPNVP